MITLKRLREAFAEIKSNLPEVKHSKIVFNDSHHANKLMHIKNKDEVILNALCPSYQGFNGIDEDASGYITFLMFFVLSKIDEKKTDEVDVVQELQPLAQKFLDEIKNHHTNHCPTFGNVDQGSVKMDPIINLSQCCGWVITMGDATYTDFAGYTE